MPLGPSSRQGIGNPFDHLEAMICDETLAFLQVLFCPRSQIKDEKAALLHTGSTAFESLAESCQRSSRHHVISTFRAKMLNMILDDLYPSQPGQPNHMTEEAHFFGVRFHQKRMAQGAVNLERQPRETRARAHIQEISLCRQKRGGKEGIQEKLDRHATSVLQAGQVNLPVPEPQFLQINAEQLEMVIAQGYSKGPGPL